MSKDSQHHAQPFYTRSREAGRAECTCGWVGPWRQRYSVARLDADQHTGEALAAGPRPEATS